MVDHTLAYPARAGRVTGGARDDAMAVFGYNSGPFFGASPFVRRGASWRPGRSPMQEINPINNLIKDLSERTDVLRGYL
ncbi:hypothetical protein GCM10009038_17840 [Salinicola rhizosphaerae]|uniref:Uncharacterized protein n=1 Tax=Salinicola rhizosphaerae TaxID=1443141 RepID=A0ABQ3DY97_9GAMM|nr:hypothetical protein GCM10009038_17840 [Salinicola rhizosphaerae]